jgi:predicted transcriptional regulator
MVLATKPLFETTAADLMSAVVITVPEDMSLKAAAHQLAKAGITGAPVVNKDGRCIGVISGTDFVHCLEREYWTVPACAASPAFSSPWQALDPNTLPDLKVHECMTRDPVVVTSIANLGELARKMIDVHIHRVIVTDSTNKPIGIVSVTDILAAVVRAYQARSPAHKETEAARC